MGWDVSYPLVNVYMAMGNHHVIQGNQLYLTYFPQLQAMLGNVILWAVMYSL